MTRCLMTIDVKTATGNDVGKLLKEQYSSRHLYRLLPELCLNEEYKKLVGTDYFLQYVQNGEEIYYLVNVINIENPLNLEVDGSGFDTTFDKIDFSIIKTLPNITKVTENCYPPSNNLVFDIEYIGGQTYSGDYDYDFNIKLIGYLDEDKKLVKINNI